MTPTLDPAGDTLHGWFSPDRPPVRNLDPGDTVTVGTLDCWWSAGPYPGGANRDRPRVPGHQPGSGHALTGPVAVRGARAGDTLAVRLDAITPGRWGTTVSGGPTPLGERYGTGDDPAVLAWELDPVARTGRNQLGHTVTLRPFLGVIGMPPPEPGEHSTIPPRRWGGNLDCRELVAGSTLYLPVPVDGGLLSFGDGHAAQGDGEVGGTAIECPMTTTATLDLVDSPLGGELDAPVAHTPAGWVTMGLGPDLDTAHAQALDAMVTLLVARYGVRRSEAFALASVVVHMRVTQVVNETVGVHAVLPDGALR
ncbi:acetamidase/formamidase family protein [Nakamurella flavida]|uniref:Acetamidase/formamidase family protein n=1 Tax=Nakamurella flavida TaxID=363630 RepID=A0A939C3U6_9ACTN|nr:acetamidase/formamidase family protein [Nakamurella flavida]MBM9478050.1 acetamidase/formamidase family protein [Nakamurella flavida]MDP9778233.1 acetamidase/formamidase [Nakamurella flavida]